MNVIPLTVQFVELVPQMEKLRRSGQNLCSHVRGSKVIIFCSVKKLCGQLARGTGRSFGEVAIHETNLRAGETGALNQFQRGNSTTLVAIDVAAGRLDLEDIRLISPLVNVFRIDLSSNRLTCWLMGGWNLGLMAKFMLCLRVLWTLRFYS